MKFTKRITIRLTLDQYICLSGRAEDDNLTVADFVRNILLAFDPSAAEKPSIQDLSTAVELVRISREIKALVHQVDTRMVVPADLVSALGKLLAETHRTVIQLRQGVL